MSTKPHWSERAKQGLRDTAEYIAENGSKIGLTGGATLGLIAGALAGASMTAGDPQLAASYEGGAQAFILASVMKVAGFAAAEEICKKHLKGSGVSFDDPDWRQQTKRDLRGATPLPVNHELNDPQIQAATKQLYNELANSPETRAEVVALMRTSSMARRAMVDGDPAAEASELITPVSVSRDEDADTPSLRM